MGEIAQVADQDCCSHRHAAAACRGAVQDLFARMWSHIGFQKRACHPVLQANLAYQRERGQEVFQRDDLFVGKAAEAIAGKRCDVAFAERVLNRPGAIIRQPFRPQLLIDRVTCFVDGVDVQAMPDFAGALVDVPDRTVKIFGGVFLAVAISDDLGFGHAVFP